MRGTALERLFLNTKAVRLQRDQAASLQFMTFKIRRAANEASVEFCLLIIANGLSFCSSLLA